MREVRTSNLICFLFFFACYLFDPCMSLCPMPHMPNVCLVCQLVLQLICLSHRSQLALELLRASPLSLSGR